MATYKIKECETVFNKGIEIECGLFYQTSISGIAQNDIELTTEELKHWGSEIDRRIKELQDYKQLVKSQLVRTDNNQ